VKIDYREGAKDAKKMGMAADFNQMHADELNRKSDFDLWRYPSFFALFAISRSTRFS